MRSLFRSRSGGEPNRLAGLGVPGVLFASRKIDRADPALVDIAPTVLRLFGLDPPAHMDGKPLYEKAFANG